MKAVAASRTSAQPGPIYPSIQAGWHSRLKSNHFRYTSELIHEFARILDVDPWFFSCQYNVVDQVNINDEKDRSRLQDTAGDLLKTIKKKYAEHDVTGNPYLFIKSDFF